MSKKCFASVLTVMTLSFVMLSGTMTANAAVPLREVSAPVLDPENAIRNFDAAVEQTERVKNDTRSELFVAVVDSFDGMSADEWALQSAQWSGLDPYTDVLFVVALDDMESGAVGSKSITDTLDIAKAYSTQALTDKGVEAAIAEFADVLVDKVDKDSSTYNYRSKDQITFVGADKSSPSEAYNNENLRMNVWLIAGVFIFFSLLVCALIWANNARARQS